MKLTEHQRDVRCLWFAVAALFTLTFGLSLALIDTRHELRMLRHEIDDHDSTLEQITDDMSVVFERLK